MGFHPHQQWESAVFQLHHHALEGFLRLFIGNFQQLQDDGLVFAQHFARGDAKQQGVTDLTCCAGNGNADGLFAHEKSPKLKKEKTFAGADASWTASRHVSYRRYDSGSIMTRA